VKHHISLKSINKRLVHEFVLFRNNLRIRKYGRDVQASSTVAEVQPVIIFNASTRLGGLSQNAAFALLTTWMLRQEGVPVISLVCQRGMSHCVLGTVRDHPQTPPPCHECLRQSKANSAHISTEYFGYTENQILAEHIAGLGLQELIDFTFNELPLGKIVLPSLRWILRRHHLTDDEDTRYLYRAYIQSAWNVAINFSRLVEEKSPQVLVTFNGTFYPEATACFIARQKGLRVITHEVGLMPFTAYFTTGEATAYPIHIPEDFVLNETQSARLDEYLSDRFMGKFKMAGIQFWKEMNSLGSEWEQRIVGFKQIVPVFTNVIFDTSQGHANRLFPDMFSWLDTVLELIHKHPETLFVIRAHPDENRPGKESRESVSDWVKGKGVDQLNNVVFIGPDEPLSSYELIAKSKFVLVYNSTIGLEASLMGAPVLCGGKARFTQLDTVFLPKTGEDFIHQAELFLSADSIQVPAIHRRNARRFLYYQLFKTSLPMGDFMDQDPIWKGYVLLKSFSIKNIRPQNSLPMKTIFQGIMADDDFLLESK
jgi:hypothetical protein